MTVSLLMEIQDTVIKYSKIIADIIRVEVEIVDSNLVRIAGTGIYKDKLNQDISEEGYVYKNVLQTGERSIIEDPGTHELCRECEKSGCCGETMEVCIPIKLQEQIIGVIGLICTNLKQKKRLKSNMDTYMQFLGQIADFISAKVYEKSENERNDGTSKLFGQIIDSIDEGILVINSRNEIIHSNENASKLLKISKEHLDSKKIEIVGISEYIFGGEIYSVEFEKRKMEFLGHLIPVFPTIASYDKIFIFSEIKTDRQDQVSTYAWKPVKLEDIEGKSKAMQAVKEKVRKIVSSNSTVLITGESGTGKELIARAIHAESSRWNKPFIAINCGAIPDTLIESELFGYVRGAFSGADPKGKIGKFELANKGVIFLDEIGDLPLFLQVKLLRVIQERKIARIGSNQMMDLDIRIIAATNRDLKKYVKENKFREDLYYRLNVIPIKLPALKDRKEDIEVILETMLKKYNRLFKTDIEGIDDEAKQLLVNYPWPGNVRELENTVEFMVNMSAGNRLLNKSNLPEGILNCKSRASSIENNNMAAVCADMRTLKEIERDYILRAVDLFGSDTKGKKLAAEKLGIGIATLYRKLDEFRLSK
jgi:sigma-54 dependent transcriptional regulator, acetoin dehydrogenase operon transcriptional activator AcoR